MIFAQSEKHGITWAPQEATNNETVSGRIDTRGFEYCAVNIVVDSHSSASHNPSVVKLSESDDTVVSNFADITAFVGGTAWTIPDADGSDPQMYRFNVDLRARKRYLTVTLTPNTTMMNASTFHLSRGLSVPVNSTDANVAALING